MLRSVPELAELLRLIVWIGGVLGAAYLLTLVLSRRARQRYRAYMRETERSLIGQRVLVTKTIKPPQPGTIVTLSQDGEAFAAIARRVLWAGQRARVVGTAEDGYEVVAIEKGKQP